MGPDSDIRGHGAFSFSLKLLSQVLFLFSSHLHLINTRGKKENILGILNAETRHLKGWGGTLKDDIGESTFKVSLAALAV